MDYICTWFCADDKGEESHFPQTGRLSSTAEHQLIYWRCIVVFYLTSRRFNRNNPHILFTNAVGVPKVDGIDVEAMLKALEVKIVRTPFGYKTPKGYYKAFQNQFYEFSILEYISGAGYLTSDRFLIVDSDCVFLRSAETLFEAAEVTGFLSFEDEVSAEYVINGLSRSDLRALYRELLGESVPDMPAYHLGEFLLSSAGNIRKISQDFRELWPQLLERQAAGLPKFNEEAHTLSYLYYRNGLRPQPRGSHMKRIWTNPLFYRNVEAGDGDLVLWHLPAEKTFGFIRLFRILSRLPEYGIYTHGEAYRELIRESMGVPHLPLWMHAGYYIKSYYRALAKRVRRVGSWFANAGKEIPALYENSRSAGIL